MLSAVARAAACYARVPVREAAAHMRCLTLYPRWEKTQALAEPPARTSLVHPSVAAFNSHPPSLPAFPFPDPLVPPACPFDPPPVLLLLQLLLAASAPPLSAFRTAACARSRISLGVSPGVSVNRKMIAGWPSLTLSRRIMARVSLAGEHWKRGRWREREIAREREREGGGEKESRHVKPSSCTNYPVQRKVDGFGSGQCRCSATMMLRRWRFDSLL